MNNKRSDLIAIANAELAEKLDRQEDSEGTGFNSVEDPGTGSFTEDIWKALYALNIIRYLLGIAFLTVFIIPAVDPDWSLIERIAHPRIFFFSTVLLLASAVFFSNASKHKKLEFKRLLVMQFSLDILLAALLTHSGGSIDSNFALLYLVVVATGSVVLPRKQAFGLASGTIILLFSEHFYSVLNSAGAIQTNYSLLANYGLIIFTSSLLISYLANRIHQAELRKFVPGGESIEGFLMREEINALKSALEKTGGNKTEAAKLLGMSFRSFRYKLTKYDID